MKPLSNMKTNKLMRPDAHKADKKRVVVTTLLMLMATGAFAQETARSSFWTDPFNSPMLPIVLILGLFVVIILLLVLVVVYVARVLNIMTRQAEMERAAKLGIEYKPSIGWWEQLWEKINASVPVENEKNIDTGHEYDGIRELDNHLPPWWKGLFYGTIIWSVGYLVVYHVTDNLPLSTDEYNQELAEAEQQARALRASRPAEVIDADALEYKADEAILLRGKAVFTSSNCQSCHRTDGGGNAIGPNLTDEFWIHGGSIKDIFSTVNTGFVEKGMPAWGKVMSQGDVRDVTFYVMSLGGTKPEGARAPQGEKYIPEPKKVAADSLTSEVTN
jgi:cytochrome c oxidase cbb3-type subunit 3